MEMGMSMVIQVGEPEQMPKPPPNFPRCGDWTAKEQEQPEENLCPSPPPPAANFAIDPPTSTAAPVVTTSSPRPSDTISSTAPPVLTFLPFILGFAFR